MSLNMPNRNSVDKTPESTISLRNKILKLLDEPSTVTGWIVSLTILLLIYISVAYVVVEVRYPLFVEKNKSLLAIVEYVVVGAFTIELVVRLICDPNRWKYLFSFYGIIDVLAVLPGLLSIVVPVPSDTAWIRVFRILRFTRISKAIHAGAGVGGITGRLIPYLALAVGLKGVMVAFEVEPWFPKIGNLSVVIGVVGFALAILLGTKLRVVNDRLYAVEDAICRIVGALRDMQYANETITRDVRSWAREFETALTNPDKTMIKNLISETDKLEKGLNRENIGGPNSAGFHRDVEYVLHRALAKIPRAFENFLKYMTMAYTCIVILAIPGFTGFVSTVLVTFVLGGIYIIIDDMDSPLDFGSDSFINARLDSIKRFNSSQV
jgi:hypothetical protein